MKKTLTLLCTLLLCGCAGLTGRNVAKFDKIEAVQIDQLVGNNLTQSPFAQKVIYLNARCETKRDGKKDFYLFTELIPPSDFVIQPGESLIVNVDGEVFSFTPVNFPTPFNGRKRYTTTFYRVPAEVISKMAKAHDARVRVKGTSMVLDKRLSRRNVMRFWEFAYKCSLIETSTEAKTGG